MEAIEGLSRDLTLVMIAHRLSTLSRCDRVIELSNGKVERIVQPANIDHLHLLNAPTL